MAVSARACHFRLYFVVARRGWLFVSLPSLAWGQQSPHFSVTRIPIALIHCMMYRSMHALSLSSTSACERVSADCNIRQLDRTLFPLKLRQFNVSYQVDFCCLMLQSGECGWAGTVFGKSSFAPP